MPCLKVRSAMLTLHDYDEADLDKFRALVPDCKYLGLAKEVCPTTDRPHAHVVLQARGRFSSAKLQNLCKPKVIDTKFPLRCTDPTNKHFVCDYLKKGTQSKAEWKLDGSAGLHFGDDADFEEHGAFVPDGHRSDLDVLNTTIQEADSWGEVIRNKEIAPSVAKHLNYAKEVFAAKKPLPKTWETITGSQTFHPWQAELLSILDSEPDNRTIIWVYDPMGCNGKTTLGTYILTNYDAILVSGKANDIFHAYDMQKIILWDIPRSTADDYINYGAIEKLKDGVFFSGKYTSAQKIRNKKAHVVVFSNNLPKEGAWTTDRLKLIKLSEAPEGPDYGEQFRA